MAASKASGTKASGAKKSSTKKSGKKKPATKKTATKKAAEETAGKAASAKKTSTNKTEAKKSAAKKSSTKKRAAKKSAAKSSAHKKPAAKKSSSKSSSRSSKRDYTRPELREKIKKQIVAGDKGGKPGQWSARKAQMVAHEYEAEGGGYKHARNATQKSLKSWGEEDWHTADGKRAIRKGDGGKQETHRYLPDAAWKELSPAEKKATDKKKVKASRKGKQFVANTPAAKKARSKAEKS